MQLTNDELNLARQWFDAIQDVNSHYLDRDDFQLAKRLHEHLGMLFPFEITEIA